jgi:hypothetical protein
VSKSTLMTSAFVAAWIDNNVNPDPACGASTVQFLDPDTESTTTVLIVNSVGGWSRTQPSELPPETLVAVKAILVAVPRVTDAGDLVIVQPPLAPLTDPAPSTTTRNADRPTTIEGRGGFGVIGSGSRSGDAVGRRPESVQNRRDRAGKGSVGVGPEAIDEQRHE